MTSKSDVATVELNTQLAQYVEEVVENDSPSGLLTPIKLDSGSFVCEDLPLSSDKELYAVILDSVFTRSYYDGKYTHDSSEAPICYSAAKSTKGMKPSSAAEKPQADSCLLCPQNKWGSSGTGKGKACASRKRLAIMLVGALDATNKFTMLSPEALDSSPLFSLRIPVMSVKEYTKYAHGQAVMFKRPPCALVTKITVHKDPRRMFYTSFEKFTDVPEELQAIILSKIPEVTKELLFTAEINDEPSEQIETF